MSGIIKQLKERQFLAEVTTMLWSPKMDLLAISNVKGEVSLYKLTFTKVWLLSPQEKSDTTVQLAWRPDGKLLAVCYENSKLLHLIDVETKNIIHKTKLSTNNLIVCVKWLLHKSSLMSNKFSELDLLTSDYLPPLPKLIKGCNTETECKEFLSNILDILYIGQKNGTVLIYIFGMFYCGTITIGNGPILQITGGSDEPIWITLKDNDCIKVTRVSCSLLEKSKALLETAQIQANIECLKSYLSRTIVDISEAWEIIFVELNEKLTRYTKVNPLGNMSADFLDLLMIGVPTVNLESFLLRDLTERGLTEIFQNFAQYVFQIKKLISENLISAGNALVYQLSELRGMVRVGATYEALGLRNETLITNAINESATFLAKSNEFQHVINQSLDNYKIFFRWLYVAILQLKDRPIMSELNKVNQQELTLIAELLNNFNKTVSNGKIINVAKVDQYLQHKDLQTPLKAEENEWTAMLEKNDCLRNYMHIIKQNVNLSLLQCHTNLVAAIENIFDEAYQGLIDHFVMTSTSFPSAYRYFVSSQITTSIGNLLLAMSDIGSNILKLYNIKYSSTESVFFTSKMITIDINHKQGKYPRYNIITDLQFYSQYYLSLLVLNKQINASYFLQVPLQDISTFENHDNEMISLADIIDSMWPKPFQGISVRWLAVSGPRKVAALLSKNKRKIRLLETEAESEDEKDDDEEDLERMIDKIKLN